MTWDTCCLLLMIKIILHEKKILLVLESRKLESKSNVNIMQNTLY